MKKILGDIDERLKEHNLGKVTSTKSRRPLTLQYTESFESKYDAFKRETYLKTASGRRLLDSLGK